MVFANIFSPGCSWDRHIYAFICFYFFLCFEPSIGWYVKMVSCKKEFESECTKYKATFNFFFNISGFLCLFGENDSFHFTYFKSDFPGIKNLSSLNDLNSLNNFSGINDLYSLISSKKTLFYTKYVQFWWFDTFHYLKKAPKSQNDSKFIKEQVVLTIEGVQNQKK